MHPKREFSAIYNYFQVLSGKMTSVPAHFRSHKVT